MERKRHGTKLKKQGSNTFIWFQMLNLRGRSKAKKKSTGETQEERENMSPLMETEMDSLRRNTDEEEEEAEGCRRPSAGPTRARPANPGLLELLCLFAFTQLRTQNRSPLLLELL